MKGVLSIQSQVVYGHVGNSAAQFALQRLGFEVWGVPTVLFSNHPGHGKKRGVPLPPELQRELIKGLADHGWLGGCRAVITGYMGSPEQVAVAAEAIEQVKQANPDAVYLCDPVMGDMREPEAPGEPPAGAAYVSDAIAEAIIEKLVPLADILAPNAYELQRLTGRTPQHQWDTADSARTLTATTVLATSTPMRDGRIGTVAIRGKEAWLCAADRLESPPNGAGDLIAALFLGHLLNGQPMTAALHKAASATDVILRRSVAAGSSELLMIAHQDEIARPSRTLPSMQV